MPGQSAAASQPAASESPVPAPSAPVEAQEPLPESIEEFDTFLATSVDKFVKLSNQLGGVVAQQAEELLKAFQAQRDFLLLTTKTKKPGQDEMSAYQKLLEPTTKALTAVQGVKEANRKSPVFTQLSAVAEGIMVLAWVTVEARTAKHVEEAFGSAQFFGNRVLKEQKDKYEDLIAAGWSGANLTTGTPSRLNGFSHSTIYSRVYLNTPSSISPTA